MPYQANLITCRALQIAELVDPQCCAGRVEVAWSASYTAPEASRTCGVVCPNPPDLSGTAIIPGSGCANGFSVVQYPGGVGSPCTGYTGITFSFGWSTTTMQWTAFYGINWCGIDSGESFEFAPNATISRTINFGGSRIGEYTVSLSCP